MIEKLVCPCLSRSRSHSSWLLQSLELKLADFVLACALALKHENNPRCPRPPTATRSKRIWKALLGPTCVRSAPWWPHALRFGSCSALLLFYSLLSFRMMRIPAFYSSVTSSFYESCQFCLWKKPVQIAFRWHFLIIFGLFFCSFSFRPITGACAALRLRGGS